MAGLRIAFVVDTYGGETAGGVVSAARFVERLRRHHEVTVVATGEPAPGKVVLPGWRPRLRVAEAHAFTFARPAEGLLREVIAGVDLVHAQFPFVCGVQALRIAAELGKPSVAGFHVQPENVLYNIGLRSPGLARWLYRRWVGAFYRRATAVVCPSEFAAARLRAHGLEVPIHVISNGVAPAALGHRGGEPDGPFLVLCVGRLAAEKRQDVILEAVARSRHRSDIRLVMAGAGPLQAKLEARAQRLGLAAEIGFLPREALDRAFSTAEVFIHASEVELEGMSVLEAMAAGLPVLVADAPESAAPSLVPGPDFLFRAGDPDDLANRLDHLLDWPGLRTDLGAASLAAAARHRLSDSTQRLEALYTSLLAAQPATLEPQPVARVHGTL